MDEFTKICNERRDRIFALMKEFNISQKELAEKIQVSPQTITDWKKGKSNSFSSKIPELSRALKTTPPWLYFGKGPKYRSDEEWENMLQREKNMLEYISSDSELRRQELKKELVTSFRMTMKNNNFSSGGLDLLFIESFAGALGISTSELLGEERKLTPENGGGQGDEADPLRSTLLHNFDQLNQEGQERLVETSDDMVSSGKYIKSDPAGLGKKA